MHVVQIQNAFYNVKSQSKSAFRGMKGFEVLFKWMSQRFSTIDDLESTIFYDHFDRSGVTIFECIVDEIFEHQRKELKVDFY